MGYNYNNSDHKGSYASGYGHNRGGQRNFNNPKPIFKKSGFEEKTTKEGDVIYIGWRKTKDGIMQVIVSEYKHTETKKDKKGREFRNLMANVTSSYGKSTVSCLHYINDAVFRFPDLNLTASLKGKGQTRNGKWVKGFFGKVNNGNKRTY